jgi:hypothetical protein
MKIIGVDLHARQQTIAMLDTDTGELVEKTLEHAGDEVGKFYFHTLWPSCDRDRSYRLDAVVSEAHGRVRDRMPRRSSQGSP